MAGTFDKLKEQLEQEDWPSVYLFKFIVPNDDAIIKKITSMFNDKTEVKKRPSKKGNYISISIKKVMLNAEKVIEIYEASAKIKGVITL